MKKLCILIGLFALVLGFVGCNEEHSLAPLNDQAEVSAETGAEKCRPWVPQGYYSGYWSEIGMSLERINVRRGVGVPFLDDVFLDEIEEGGRGWTAGLGLTFDVDGSVYIINNWLDGDPSDVDGELTKINMITGEFTVIADLENHFSGSEIDDCGNLYSVGFEPQGNNSGYYFSPLYGDKLCFIDKYSGDVTPIGLGTGLHDVMDLAFDSEGTLWATTENKLFTISLDDGVATWVCDITNVPPAPEGETNPMMIMSIAFDKHDRLFGTAMVGFCEICDPYHSPIMKIDSETGEGTLLGYSELGYNHGGDTKPHRVKVAHRNRQGEYSCRTISLRALPAHLAHGDYVPGTNGYDCECP
ncbi:MAG: hypothetical protein GY780_18780 [bacterium]|nr:hypothetical protein [bacterium]